MVRDIIKFIRIEGADEEDHKKKADHLFFCAYIIPFDFGSLRSNTARRKARTGRRRAPTGNRASEAA